MRISSTLSTYMARHFLVMFFVVLAAFASLAVMIDTVELLRRASGKEHATFALLLPMAFSKLPSLLEQLLPFAALFGAMMSLTRLTNSGELVVARSAGVSVWQFLTPLVMIALLIGGFVVTVYNPVAATLMAQYRNLEAKNFRGKSRLLAVAGRTGLWLREARDEQQFVIHARSIYKEGAEFGDVTVFRYSNADYFQERLDANRAILGNGYWDLIDVAVNGADSTSERLDHYRLDTSLTLQQILDSIAAPQTMSFWQLPGFIKSLEDAGFSAVRHRMHWHAVLSTPLLLVAMVFVAASFSLRFSRRKGRAGWLIFAGILTGFLIYFFTDIVHAVGLSGKIPVSLAAWAPAVVTCMIAIAMMFHLEDG